MFDPSDCDCRPRSNLSIAIAHQHRRYCRWYSRCHRSTCFSISVLYYDVRYSFIYLIAFCLPRLINLTSKKYINRGGNANSFGSDIEPYPYGPVDTQPMGFSPPNSPGLSASFNDMQSYTGYNGGASGNASTFGPSGADPGMQYTGTGYNGGAGGNPATFGPSGTESGMQYTGTGNDVTMFNAAPQVPVHNIPNPNFTPFVVGGAALAAGAGAAAGVRRKRAETSSSTSRTSSTSDDTLRPLVTHSFSPQNTGYPQKLNSYPAGLAAYVQRQSLGLSEEQSSRNRSGSIGSVTTVSSIHAAGNSSGVGAGLKPSMAAAMSRAGQHPQQQYTPVHGEPFARMSSPESIAEDSMIAQYQSQENTAERSGSSSSRVHDTPPRLRLVGGLSSLSLDGKGRPLGPRRKAPVVHLDGGEYQEAQPSQRIAPQPPAYAE